MIITLIGRKGSGKDTVASLLCKKYEEDGVEPPAMLSFARPMKEILVELFGYPDISYFDSHELKENVHSDILPEFSPRQLMEWFGNSIRTKFGATFWLNKLLNDISKLDENKTVIITDCRFPHEAHGLKTKFGNRVKFVYINANERIGPLPENAADSEKAVGETIRSLIVSNMNFSIVDNNGELNGLKGELNELFG